MFKKKNLFYKRQVTKAAIYSDTSDISLDNYVLFAVCFST